MDRKSPMRLHWMIKLYTIKNSKERVFSFNNLEELVGYPAKKELNGKPQATFRYFLRELINKNILIAHATFKTHLKYKINRKLLLKEIKENVFFKEINLFIKSISVIYVE